MDEFERFETLAVHSGETADPETGALRQPLHMSTTFKLPSFGVKLFEALFMETADSPYVYTRWANPTLRALEKRLADLEGAEACVVSASGMATISSLAFTLLKGGDHVVVSEVCYAGAQELFGIYMPKYGVEATFVDTCDLEQVKAAIRPNTKLIYTETPANPILRIADIRALADIAHENGIPLSVDSTFASPAVQQPIALGADYVIHSLTKYINGHGDALGGALMGTEEALQNVRKEMLVHLGGALSPFNAWLINRGLTTLPVRVKQQAESALKVARFLEGHPKIARVMYPGLESHPHHDLAMRQMKSGGGMIAFQLKGGLGAAINMAEHIKVFQYATSLGHAHSLMFYYPADLYVDHVEFLNAEQKTNIRKWTGEGVVRASIGLENADDLIEDLDRALTAKTIKGMVGPAAYELLKKYLG